MLIQKQIECPTFGVYYSAAEAMDRGAAACFNKAMIVREATRFVTLIKSVARGLIEAEAEPVAIAA